MAQTRIYRSPGAADAWSSFDRLRRDLDALTQRLTGSPTVRAGVFPAVNLYETADAYVLTAELPGMSADEIDVSLEGSTVTLSGERRIDDSNEEGITPHRRERQSGRFRRAFELPAAIDADKVEAVHRTGVLMLRLPKHAEHQPRQISISTD